MMTTTKYSMFKKIFSFVAVLFLVTVLSRNVSAQGSPYYFLGFGDPIGVTSAHLSALSQSAVAMTDPTELNELNPASYSFLNRTVLDIRLRFAYNQSTLASETSNAHLLKFSGFNIGSILSNKLGVGVALGFLPVTDAEATSTRIDSIGTTIQKREGGLSQFYLGASVRPISALTVGARADVLFGNMLTKFQASINGDNGSPGIFQREYALSGVRGTFGFLLSLDSLFSELHGLTIGASYSTSSALTSTQRTIVTPTQTTTSGSLLDTILEADGYGNYPSKIQIGISGRIGDRYRLEADISGQDFSSAYIYSITKNGIGDAALGSSNRFSLGFERLAAVGDDARGRTFWDKAGIRFGVSYATLPFKPAPGVTVSELAFSTGLGLPFVSGSLVDVAGLFGIRTPSNTSVAPKDMFFKVGVSFSISEKWFVPLRRGDDDQ